eukprot:834981_1
MSQLCKDMVTSTTVQCIDIESSTDYSLLQINMNTVAQATVHRIQTFADNVLKLTDDLYYITDHIANPETKAALIQHQFIETLFALCQNESVSASHRVQSLQIMNQLAALYSARNIINTYIELISTLLKSEDETVRLNTCKLVSTLCFFQDSVLPSANSEITPILYELLFDDADDVVSETLSSLSFITNYIRNAPENVVEKLIQLLSKTDKQNTNRAQNNLNCLWNICTKWDIKEIAIKHQVVPTTSRFLSTSFAKQEPSVSRCATGLLMPISVCESGKNAILSNPKIISSLSYLVSNKSVNADITNNSGVVLSNIADHPKGLLMIGKELIQKHALLIQLFGCDKSATIGHVYMKDEKALIQQSAVQLLALIAQQKDGQIAVWKCLNILPQLIDLFMSAEKERTISLALDCIIMLCQSNQCAQRILRQEARRSPSFLETARKISLLQPFLTPELM